MTFDEDAARKLLQEMETWGDDCSPSAQALREDLRAHLSSPMKPPPPHPEFN